jgi:hypothetical protein
MHRHHVQKKPAGTTVDIGEFFSELLVRENVIDLSTSSFRAGVLIGAVSSEASCNFGTARRLRMPIDLQTSFLDGRSTQSNSDVFAVRVIAAPSSSRA